MNIYSLLATLLQLYGYILLGRALVSWIPNLDPANPIVQLLYRATEPVLDPIRRLIPPLGGVMDISIIVAFFATVILGQMLTSIAG